MPAYSIKSKAKRNIKFRSLELIGPKVRTAHSGEEWEKNSTFEKKALRQSGGHVCTFFFFFFYIGDMSYLCKYVLTADSCSVHKNMLLGDLPHCTELKEKNFFITLSIQYKYEIR